MKTRLYRRAIRDLAVQLNELKPDARIAVIAFTTRLFEVPASQVCEDLRTFGYDHKAA